MLRRTTPRPSRAEVDQAALALVRRYGPEILATARRYSATPEDAEDAYQRGMEILLAKAPATADEELVPWLKTVVKHEAFAVRRQRERAAPITDNGELGERPSVGGSTHEQAERFERLRFGAEAMARLKPQEIRALLLRAEGHSYKEICAITGWTYTKVNRCISEGRRAFLKRVAGIEAGAECERLLPVLSALADGEASARDLRVLRPHLKTCLNCRARLREFRSAPARVAALLPPAALVAQDTGGTLRAWLESIAGAAQHKTSALGERLHTATELATGQKVAAVAASTAALAGGGATVERLAERPDPVQRDRSAQPQLVREQQASDPAPTPDPSPTASPPPEPAPQAPPPPDPATEFAPGAAPAPHGAGTGGLAPDGGGGVASGSGAGSGGEFGP